MSPSCNSANSMISWMYTAFAVVLGLTSPYLHFSSDYYWILYPLGIGVTLFDFVVSDRPWKNLEIMKLNGFTPTYIWTVSIFNTVYFDVAQYYIARVILHGEKVIPRFDLSLVLTVIIILAIGDYLFYAAHKVLHSTEMGARLHLMHHCCIHTSLSTNVWFHPLDLLIEFFGPFTVSLVWWYISKDTFAFIVITSIMQTWYSMTHDENISNHHGDHHKLVNSDYPIYVSYKVPNPKDKIMTDRTEFVFQLIKRWKWIIMAFWGISAIGCAFFALDLPNQTVFQYLPPPGSESDTAYNQINKYFPQYLFIDVEVILIEAKWNIHDSNMTIIDNPNTKELALEINDTLWNRIDTNYGLLLDVQTFYDFSNVTSKNYSYNGKTINPKAIIESMSESRYVAESGDVMLLYVQSNIHDATQSELTGFIDDIKDHLSSLSRHYHDYKVVLTGGITIFQEMNAEIASDITSKDIMMMPFIFCIMIYMIGSWKLVGLPGLNLGMCILISFGIFYPFSINGVQVNPLAPSIMMFVSMALSIDYSMFLLSRFASERRAGKSVDDSVRAMLRYSAHVVMLSGVILMICYCAIVVFPVSGMETIGWGAAIAIFCCILINITFSTATILAFPNFYGELETFPSCCIRNCARLFSKCSCCSRCADFRDYGLNSNAKELAVSMINDDDDAVMAASAGGSEISPQSENGTTQADHQSPPSPDDDVNFSISGAANSATTNKNQSMRPESIIEYTDERDAFGGNSPEMKAGPRAVPVLAASTGLEKECAEKQNCYFRLAKYITRWPYNFVVPLIVYLLMIPGLYELSTLEFSIDFTMNFPKHRDSVEAWDLLTQKFNPGDVAPFYILVKSKDESSSKSIWDQNYFNALCAIGTELVESGLENITTMSSMGFIPDQEHHNLSCVEGSVTITTYEMIINNPTSVFSPVRKYVDTPYWQYFMSWWNDTVNMPDQTVSVILALPQFDPYVASALDNCNNYRDIIHSVASRADIEPYVDVYVHNQLFWEIDSLDRTNKQLPYELLIIVSITFVIIGAMFRSVFLPLRLLLCIVVPILFVYGVVTGVYQHGWLDWLTWEAVGSTDGIYWMLPIITCTVLVGLALDYEIFLFSRVYELRSKGYSNTAAIILGVSSTGPIISAAGCVMALSFVGLLLQQIVSSNQMGLVFVFGVLVDTFVVRPLLVPSVLSFADKWNWWPTAMPRPKMDEYGNPIADMNMQPL